MQCIGEYHHSSEGILSVHWGISFIGRGDYSALEDITTALGVFNESGDIMSASRVYHDWCGGYHQCIGAVPQKVISPM